VKLVIAMFAALLLTLPGFAQSAVDNCCQTGRDCASDADWVQGWFDYQNGQCAAAAPATSASAVDNCCQVGRACASDADWVQGWFDYQNGQCPAAAPAVSSPAASAPAASPAAIDNCCQAGRACASDADWVQGWLDYRHNQCDGSVMTPASSASPQDSYSFSGRGRSRTATFTLTRGKWEFRPSLGRQADTFLHEVNSAGEVLYDGQCLTFPTNFHYYGQTNFGLRLPSYSLEFVARHQCNVQFLIFGELDAGQVSGNDWSISIRKTDGNF